MLEPAFILKTARQLMAEYTEETGLGQEGGPPRRYLWSDALAVCNYLALFRRTGDAEYIRLAHRLIDQAHHVLGRHRPDDERSGWISGLDEQAGEEHPTAGGLRIGKEHNERKAEEPIDENQEWRKDGQYFHYLTKWMHALHQFGAVSEDPRYQRWAMELAKVAHGAFSYQSASGKKKMYWKLSIDLSYPLVLSMGHHDALDGFVTYRQLQAAAREEVRIDLREEAEELAELCKEKGWATEDPLGTGALLFDAHRMVQMMVRGETIGGELLENVLAAAQVGLESFTVRSPFRLPADYRLPFRELGLSLGIKSLPMMQRLMAEYPQLFSPPCGRRMALLLRHLPLAERIDAFWVETDQRGSANWQEHRQINQVTLASSLLPDGFLNLGQAINV
jgi:hypothetical protein